LDIYNMKHKPHINHNQLKKIEIYICNLHTVIGLKTETLIDVNEAIKKQRLKLHLTENNNE